MKVSVALMFSSESEFKQVDFLRNIEKKYNCDIPLPFRNQWISNTDWNSVKHILIEIPLFQILKPKALCEGFKT